MAELKAITHRVTQCDEVRSSLDPGRTPWVCVWGRGVYSHRRIGLQEQLCMWSSMRSPSQDNCWMAPFVPLPTTLLSCPAMGQTCPWHLLHVGNPVSRVTGWNEPRAHLSWAWGEWSGDLVRGFKSLSTSLAPSSLLAFCGDRKPGWLGLHNESALCAQQFLSGWRAQKAQGEFGGGCSHPESKGSWSWRKPFQMLSSLLWGGQKVFQLDSIRKTMVFRPRRLRLALPWPSIPIPTGQPAEPPSSTVLREAHTVFHSTFKSPNTHGRF